MQLVVIFRISGIADANIGTHTHTDRAVIVSLMCMISAGLDQSDDEALYADVGQRTLYTEHYVSLWRRILTFLGKCRSLRFWHSYQCGNATTGRASGLHSTEVSVEMFSGLLVNVETTY